VGLLAVAWFGTLPAWLTFVAVVAAAFALRGGQLGPAVGYLREANKALEQENLALKAQLRDRSLALTELQARTDLAPLQAAMLDAMTSHEARAQERFERALVILSLIAEQLGENHDA
jgi:hypothetical protein